MNYINTIPLKYNNIENNINQIKNIILIHDQIYDYDKFVKSVNLESYPIVYNLNSSLEDLQNLLKDKFININRVAFIFHDAGINQLKEFIDNKALFTYEDLEDNVTKYSDNLQFIIDLVKDFNVANLDYLACNTLQYEHLRKYYNIIHKETNVIVGASNDLTGNIKYGGDWILESTNEDIRNIYFTEDIINYQYTLATTSLSQNGGTLYFRQITSTSSIEYSSDNSTWTTIDNANWPVQITNSNPLSTNILTVLITTDITFNSTISVNGYFIIATTYITINGNNKIVTINGITNYPGLIQNGTSTVNGYTNITVKNFGVITNGTSTLQSTKGWIGQNYFGKGINSGTITVSNCYSTGNINNTSGGILGNGTGHSTLGTNTITVTNCYSTGSIGINGGGILGTYTSRFSQGGSIIVLNCYSTGNIESIGGGIFGYYTGDSATGGIITASNCYSIGNIGTSAGGIFGQYTKNSNTLGTVTATNCYTIGSITTSGNGIFGSNNNGGTSSYCIYVDGSTSDLIPSSTQTANTWIDGNATLTIKRNDSTPSAWLDYSTNTNVPWLLSSFNSTIYNPNTLSLNYGVSGTSSAGLFTPDYTYSIVSTSPNTPSITINSTTGVLTFPNTLSTGSYTINVLVGKIVSSMYYSYNINTYTLTVTSTISTSTTISQSDINSYVWPVTINGGTPTTPVIITFNENLNITGSANNYFIINSNWITVNGNNKIVTIDNIINYPGLFNNGTISNISYTNITITNIGISSINGSYLTSNSGWICQGYFGRTINEGEILVNNCYSTGGIRGGCGGIFGAYIGINGTNGTITALNCYNNNLGIGINSYGGGIYGQRSGNSNLNLTIIARNCYSYGNVGNVNTVGGIFAQYANINTLSENCYSYLTFSSSISGGIFGAYSSGTANNCYFAGTASQIDFGTIFGTSSSGTANYCYSTILGRKLFNSANNAIANYCYTNNTIIGDGTLTINNCYAYNNNWLDSSATSTIGVNDSTPSKWLDYSTSTNVPWLLSSFNSTIYNPNTLSLNYGVSGTSSAGLFTPGYTYLIVSTSPNAPSITINSTTGVLTFPNTFSTGSYTINVLVGKIVSSIYYAYNINTYTLTVNKADQTITFNTLSTKTYGDAPFNLSATASSGLTVTYTSSNTSVATISGSTVTIVGVGTSVITASQAGNSNYNSATNVSQTLTVKLSQTITFNSLPTKTYGDSPFVLSGSSSSGLTVSYTSSNISVATILGDTVTIVSAGFCIITAYQNGNDIYNSAPNVFQSLIINKANQTITFNKIDDKIYGNTPFNLIASSTSGLTVLFKSSNTNVIKIYDNRVVVVGLGISVITAYQPGNSNYNESNEITQNIIVLKYNIQRNSPQLAYIANTRKYYLGVIKKNNIINQKTKYYDPSGYTRIFLPNESITYP